MAVFEYKARDRMGQMVSGTMTANNADAVGQELSKMGHFPVKIKEEGGSVEARAKKEGKSGGGVLAYFNKVTTEDLVLFTRQMSTLFNAGIPLLAILSALSDQVSNARFKDVLLQMRRDIEDGLSLSEAMQKHEDVFPELFVSMIEAGEAGGVMDDILARLADLIEKQAENEKKIKAAMRYPKMVVGAMAVAIGILMWKVVPIFVSMFEKAKIDLPWATKLLIAANNAAHQYWHFLLGGLVVIYIMFTKYTQTEKGKYQWHYICLKIPIMGNVLLKSNMSKFSRILGTLQAGGVPILDILSVSARVVDNMVLSKIIANLRNSVQEGLGLAAPLSQSGFVPPLVIQMIAAGEESGALDDMMMKVADYYDEEVDQAVKNLSSMIEPILLVFMGGLVLFLALAIFMPMWDMSKMAKK
jgi:type II secretory pathway component PulF